MTLVTLRPSGTASNNGAVTGAGSAHAALNDNSDSSYVQFTGPPSPETWTGAIDDLTLPAGAVLKAIALRARVLTASGTPTMTIFLDNGSTTTYLFAATVVNWGTPTTITAVSAASSLSDSAIDGARLIVGNGQGAFSELRVHEAYVDITYVEQPVVSVDVPAGTITDTNLPTITWSTTLDGDGGAQTFYRVKVFSDAQYGAGGFDPDTSSPTVESGPVNSSAASWQPTVTLPDDTYRAYVFIGQVVNGQSHLSAWEYTEFAIDVALPGVPDLTASPDNDNARVQLDIDEGVGDATVDFYEIECSDDLGVTFKPVRHLAGLLTPDDPTVWDYEGQNNYVRYYRVRAVHDYSGAYAASDWATGSAIWASPDWWLKHPNKPALNVPVAVRSLPSVTRTARQGVFQALGSRTAVVVQDTRMATSGTVTLRALTLQAQSDLDALLDEYATLLLQSPTGEGGPGYVRFGTHNRSRIVDGADATRVLEELEFNVVASPDGDVVAWPE